MSKRLFCELISIIILKLVCPFAFNEVKAEQAESVVLLESESGRVLYEKNGNKKRSIASLTKIITVITAIKYDNINKTVDISSNAENVEGSKVYLKCGEKYILKDLLYGLIMRSGNDCALAIAENFYGGYDCFINKMNEVAKEFGAMNSLFKNPHGLEESNHYSTAYDVAVISSKAMKNDLYRKISSEKNYVAKELTGGRIISMKNKNKLLFSYEKCNGGKTGYTKVSGRCLQTAAFNGDMHLVCVVLGYGDTYNLSKNLYEKAFNEYTRVVLAEKGKRITFDGKDVFSIPVYADKDLIYPLSSIERNKLKFQVFADTSVKFPLKQGEKVGVLKFYLENQLIFSENIYSILSVKNKTDGFPKDFS